jgi:hypothetical protein
MPAAPGEACGGRWVGGWECFPDEEVTTSNSLTLLVIPRGCLEAGLESLLKAAGGNLLILRISHCPNILTDRSLWLASCYCRALQAVTYRWVLSSGSSTHPLCALGSQGP